MGKKNAVLPVAKARILTARVKEEWCDVCLPVCLTSVLFRRLSPFWEYFMGLMSWEFGIARAHVTVTRCIVGWSTGCGGGKRLVCLQA